MTDAKRKLPVIYAKLRFLTPYEPTTFDAGGVCTSIGIVPAQTKPPSDEDAHKFVPYVPKVECRTCGYFNPEVDAKFFSICGHRDGLRNASADGSGHCHNHTTKSEEQ
jgi:hypothetical protein